MSSLFLFVLNITLVGLFWGSSVQAENVLVLAALSSPSHKNVFSPIVTGLAEKGHQVTVVTAWKPKSEQKNVRELVVLPGFDYFPNISTMKIRKEGIRGMLSQSPEPFLECCRKIYRNPEFQDLLRQPFDVHSPRPLLFHSEPGESTATVIRPGSHVALWTDEIKANVSVLLMNSHFSINGARPVLPDVIEIGGGHCKPGKPLPKDLEEFVSKGDNGFIFFSLGSIVKPHELSDEVRNAFLNAFGKLKYQVIWKWNGDAMPGLPDNVKLLKWVPQQDVLAHPKIKLFMSHSGLLSVQEAVYHGVPVLSVPIFGDQDLNANVVIQLGFGEFIEILDVTAESLEAKITQMLSNNKYQDRVKELSTVFRDRSRDPVDEAVYWTEYVMRYKGATHLRSASRDLNFFQYHCLDVGAFLVVSIVLVLWLLKTCTVRLIRKCRGKRGDEPTKKTN
ncbi:unnamed protein product [Allacma fusca]|uniref:UDP-glucuronosyltransferase n=1 Tax=Allacma fusca TaxID=39272 RepID=A0A8J2KDC4_9HEXA|nr:unnamed protein product [Allacma fusca]